MSYTRYRERSRDVQDGLERHVWGKQEYVKSAGSVIKVRGTDSKDEEAAVLNIAGNSFNLKKDSDSEVFLLASSSDTNLKMAVLTIPRDKQRRWEEGDGGVQHPTDPEFALDFSDKLAHITKNKFGVGEKGEFEVKEKKIFARLDGDKFIIDGELIVNKLIKTPQVTQGKEKPPNFEGNKQAKESGDSGGGDSGGGGGGTPAVAAVQSSTERQRSSFVIGENGAFELDGDTLVLRVGKLIVDGELVVNKRVITPEVVSGSEKPPAFEPE